MYALEKDHALRISSIFINKYYDENLEYLFEIFEKTRNKEHRGNPESILSLQLSLAKFETKIWDALREGRALAKELKAKKDPKLTEDLAGIEEHILIHEQLLRISKVIMDGVAWRNLRYNRMLLETSARGTGTGAIDVNKRDFQSEFTWAFRISKQSGRVVIINDLTNFLRIGDLTEIEKGVALVHEIKKNGKRVINIFTLQQKKAKDLLSKQNKRLVEFQKVALTETVMIDGSIIRKVPIYVNVKSHIDKVKILISKTKTTTYEEIQIEPYQKISLINFRQVKEAPKDKKKEPVRGQLVIVHSNWDSFYYDELGNFMRLMLPYSIFPFKNRDCMNLMSGHYLLKSELDMSELKRCFRKKGWNIIDPDLKELDKFLEKIAQLEKSAFTAENLYSSMIDAPPFFTISKGPFHFPIDSTLLVRSAYEFFSFETLNEIAEEAFKRASRVQKDEIYFPILVGEHKLWN